MKKPKSPRLVTVAIFTTVTLIFWVFFSLYNILVSTPVIDVSADLLEPLNPELDTTVLNSLSDKVFVEEGDVENVLPTPTQKPAAVLPTETPVDTGLESATETPVPQITEGV